MLPTRLNQVKEMIKNTPEMDRTDQEQELLEELIELDRFVGPEMTKPGTMPDYMFKTVQIVSGPSGACPCCGRKDKRDADRFIPRIP